MYHIPLLFFLLIVGSKNSLEEADIKGDILK